ncbi:hypothetical protein [Lacisediminimonas sp.]|uniref:hypothetical protein n=1 Tax=Lacisediminimonas sp. TaxID=3060582 RepID=UPI00271A7261|nr:hypothetical protein [Lacisediminimonas sp.]MDO8299018.1 hypothetical protein [Lacisediminimonas sp.]
MSSAPFAGADVDLDVFVATSLDLETTGFWIVSADMAGALLLLRLDCGFLPGLPGLGGAATTGLAAVFLAAGLLATGAAGATAFDAARAVLPRGFALVALTAGTDAVFALLAAFFAAGFFTARVTVAFIRPPMNCPACVISCAAKRRVAATVPEKRG